VLRDYQKRIIDEARVSMRSNRHICVQAPTGSGKTVIFTEITRRITGNNLRTWVMVPRNELLDQASKMLKGAGIPHGRIAAGIQESKAFQVHVVSKDTLIRRYDRILKSPDFLVVDEAHIALDRQKEIAAQFDRARLVGFTATPERGDGRGLAELYDDLIQGPSLAELVRLGHLSIPRYFCPPLEGLEDVHRRGTEYKDDDLQALLKERKVYGKAIDMYKRHADGLPCLIFTRSVKSARQTAARFREVGYRSECIDGNMSKVRRAALLDGFRRGQLNILTSADLLTYGVDLPTVSCIIMLRPTLSTALFFQMIGRGLRVAEGKKSCVILDHVNNIATHGHPLKDRAWDFHGRGVTPPAGDPSELAVRLCPELEFLYCDKRSCVGCELNKSGRTERPIPVVECELREVEAPENLFPQLPKVGQKEIEARVRGLVSECREAIRPGPIGEFLNIARALGKDWRWVYDEINDQRHLVNIALLTEIGRQLKYKPGWVYHKRKELIEEMEGKQNVS